jgi:hypothetical protein
MRNAIDFYLKDRAKRYNKSFRLRRINIQFPDKSGFTLRYNPASGISATLRPAKLVRVGFTT